MDVDVVLVSLIGDGPELRLSLTTGGQLPRRRLEKGDDPDVVAQQLATEALGSSVHVERHEFRCGQRGTGSDLVLVYRQLLPRDAVNNDSHPSRRLRICSGFQLNDDLDATEGKIALSVITAIRTELRQVMRARENKRGLIHLLHLLPEVFDHKELTAAYVAVMDEKPASSLMLARMMLDRYTIGTGVKEREIQGRDLIREYDDVSDEVLADKWKRNRDLYRKGGPKTKRLYRQVPK